MVNKKAPSLFLKTGAAKDENETNQPDSNEQIKSPGDPKSGVKFAD